MRRITVAEALRRYSADRAPVVAVPERITQTIQFLVPVLGRYHIGRSLPHHVRAYVDARLGQGVQAPTVRRELTTLRSALRLAWREGRIPAPPPIQMPPNNPARQHVLGRDEIRPLLQCARRRDHRVWLFVVLAITTGARLGAILDLTWERVDLRARQIDYKAPHPRAGRRKHRAVVPIDARLWRVLKAERGHSAADQLVIGLVATTLRRRLHRIAREAGISEPVTPHVFRHTAATELLRRVPLVMASRMIGHRSVAVTEQVYGHLTVGDLSPGARSLARFAGL